MQFKQIAVYAAAAATGLFLVTIVPDSFAAVRLKLSGRGDGCPWSNVFSEAGYSQSLHEAVTSNRNGIRQTATDTGKSIDRWAVPGFREFWIPRNGTDLDGKGLLSYLLGDHAVLAERLRDSGVRTGDIVLDVGAHVGAFADRALQRGARKVIAMEPDPLNRECLVRNFASEIAAQRMIVVPEGAWSSKGQLTLHQGTENSGMSSVLSDQPGATFQIDVTTIDDLVKRLGLQRVDFVKMDIEGAEREALKGAGGTLRDFRPRIMLDAYHREDDHVVLPQIINTANPAYRQTCACEILKGNLTPHVILFQ
jgi:FkbM family methyltransferase